MTEKQRFEIVKRLLPRLKHTNDVVNEAQRVADWIEQKDPQSIYVCGVDPFYAHMSVDGIGDTPVVFTESRH